MAKRYGTTAAVLLVARKKQECISQRGQTPICFVAPGISALLKPSPFINSSSVVGLHPYLRNGGKQGGKAPIQRIGCLSKNGGQGNCALFRDISNPIAHHFHR